MIICDTFTHILIVFELQLQLQNCLFDIITKYMGQKKTMYQENKIK